MFKYGKLLALMSDKGITQKAAAKELGISENSFTNKVKGRSNFNSEEIAILSDMLSIQLNEIGSYFFNLKV